MKKILFLTCILIGIQSALMAQTNLKLGVAGLTETVVYPGFVFEFEIEKMQTENISLPLRFDIGFYNHPRNHKAVFLDIHQGFRRYFKSGLVLENAFGIGVILPFYSETVWEVNEEGNVAETSNFAGVDFIPSITLGIGYKVSKSKNNMIFFRPKIFWQFPFNGKALPHSTFQLGYVHTFKTK